MAANPNSKSVLILDDDSYFRQLVTNLLKQRGYRTSEAGSPEEASKILSAKDTALIIVDYRLPRLDGMTWIAQYRESGGTLPIVFCSGQRADASLFNRLRNVLGVSLILQKPIIPATFIQQLEDLLPNYEKVDPQAEVPWNAMGGGKANGQDQRTTFSQSKDELASLLEEATNEYITELETVWKDLVRLVNEFNNNTDNMQALSEAIRIAHTIRGTAGSLSLTEIGKCAGKLEDLLRYLDPDKSTDQEVIWSEIIRKLADGTSAVQDALLNRRISNHGAAAPEAIANILFVTNSPEVITLATAPDIVSMANIIVTEDIRNLGKRIDAAFIDLSLAGKEAWAWAREIRRYAGNDKLPLAYIMPDGASMQESEKLLCGASLVLERPVLGDDLHAKIFELLSIGFQNQPRILVIDDDEVLTKFVSGLLQTERMFTQTLNNPASAPEAVAEFQPDLILLDVVMPVLTGYEVCRQIREIPDWQDIPVIFLTSQTSTQAKTAAFAAGATDFLTKPILSEELLTRVSTHIRTSARRQKSHGMEAESGLLNMEAFLHQFKELYKSRRETTITVGAITVDNFDELSLFQGIQQAKHAASQLCKLLSLGLRAEDLICRYGDQGCLIAVNNMHVEKVAEALAVARDGFSQVNFKGVGGTFKATFSAGVAQSRAEEPLAEALLQAAYKNMLQARKDSSGLVQGG